MYPPTLGPPGKVAADHDTATVDPAALAVGADAAGIEVARPLPRAFVLRTAQAAHAAVVAVPPSFFDLPDIVANLNTGNRRAAFIKLKVKLELVRAEDQPGVQAALPRILDLFQGYLREMRPDELRGTASTYRLREELLARTNLAVAPARVTAVLFTEMIVQ